MLNVAADKYLYMKKLSYLLLFSLFISTVSYAQLRKIPAEVTEAFSGKYPDAKSVEWRDKLSGFTASFSLDSNTYLASFDNKGNWESTEHVISQEELPDAVQDGFEKSKYADWNVSLIYYIELPNDEVHYRIEAGKGDIKKRNLYYNSEGRLLKDKLTL